MSHFTMKAGTVVVGPAQSLSELFRVAVEERLLGKTPMAVVTANRIGNPEKEINAVHPMEERVWAALGDTTATALASLDLSNPTDRAIRDRAAMALRGFDPEDPPPLTLLEAEDRLNDAAIALDNLMRYDDGEDLLDEMPDRRTGRHRQHIDHALLEAMRIPPSAS